MASEFLWQGGIDGSTCPGQRGLVALLVDQLFDHTGRMPVMITRAVSGMYVEGVSTRCFTKIKEKLCGFQVSSGQVFGTALSF